MSHFEISCPIEHTKHNQWLFSISLCTGKYDRHTVQTLLKEDFDFNQKISIHEIEEIFLSCEKTTGNFLCTRFVLLLIISFAFTAFVLFITAFYFTTKKTDKMTVIYTYVIAISIGVFCNLLLFLIYMLISSIYEKQLNLYLGQTRILRSYEMRNLYWRANGSRLTLNNIYNEECDKGCQKMSQKAKKMKLSKSHGFNVPFMKFMNE